MKLTAKLALIVSIVFQIIGYSYSIPSVQPYSRPSAGLSGLPSATPTGEPGAVSSLPSIPIPPILAVPIEIGPTTVYTVTINNYNGYALPMPVDYFNARYVWTLLDGTQTTYMANCTTSNRHTWTCYSPMIPGVQAQLIVDASAHFPEVTLSGSNSIEGGAPHMQVALTGAPASPSPTPSPSPTATVSH